MGFSTPTMVDGLRNDKLRGGSCDPLLPNSVLIVEQFILPGYDKIHSLTCGEKTFMLESGKGTTTLIGLGQIE